MRRQPLDGAFRYVSLESPARRLPAAFFFAGRPDGRRKRSAGHARLASEVMMN
jgi:hypothetical protein